MRKLKISGGITFLGYLIILHIIFTLNVGAQQVKIINNNNNEVVSVPGLLSSVMSSDQSVEKSAISWFINQGYLNVEIEQKNDSTYRVNTGCLFSFDEISITNSKFQMLSRSISGNYSQDILEKEIYRILTELNDQGYIFAEVFLDSLIPNEEKCIVTASININEGTKWYSGGIVFSGARLNSQKFLQRISGYQDSVIVTPEFGESIRANLIQSELFQEVGEPEILTQSGKAVILIPVQERNLNAFDGLLGYVPDQNGNGQIVGDFELSLWNVINQGNGLDLKYQRLRPETSRLNIGVSQDWFGSIPLGTSLKFNFFQNDTTYQTRDLMLESYYMISRGVKLTGGVGRISSTQGNDALNVPEPNGNKTYGEFGFRYSSLDNPEIPRKGLKFNVSLGAANKSIDIDSLESFSQQYLKGGLNAFLPLTMVNILAFTAHSFYLNGTEFTDSDLIRFGGANSFRGYSEEQFTASRMIWGDIEYRYMLDRDSYLFLFGAAGTYHRPKLLTETNNQFKVSDWLYSTGFGISYRIRIGRLKFTYAISPEESIGNGKVHLGIKTSL